MNDETSRDHRQFSFTSNCPSSSTLMMSVFVYLHILETKELTRDKTDTIAPFLSPLEAQRLKTHFNKVA